MVIYREKERKGGREDNDRRYNYEGRYSRIGGEWRI